MSDCRSGKWKDRNLCICIIIRVGIIFGIPVATTYLWKGPIETNSWYVGTSNRG